MINYFHINCRIQTASFLIMMVFAMLFSCKEQDEAFKQYVVEGGISYLGGVSNLKANVGYNRLEVQFNVVDPITTQVGIYWNDYQDSVMIDVNSKKDVRQIIELTEGQYSLFVKSFDQYGNSSNPLELVTKTVGDNYISSLSHRGINSKTSRFEDDLYIDWRDADINNGAMFTDLVYTDVDGKEKRYRVENEEETTSLDDYKSGTTFKRITYYSPDGQWLDTITPPVVNETSIMIDKSLGEVIEYSSQHSNYPASDFYSDNLAYCWLTLSDYPHYIVIDLGIEVPVSGFNIWPSYEITVVCADPRAPTKIKFECSVDNIEWTTVGEFDYDNSMYYHVRDFNIPTTQARYVRFTGVECSDAPVFSSSIGGPGTTEMCLGELVVFSQLED